MGGRPRQRRTLPRADSTTPPKALEDSASSTAIAGVPGEVGVVAVNLFAATKASARTSSTTCPRRLTIAWCCCRKSTRATRSGYLSGPRLSVTPAELLERAEVVESKQGCRRAAGHGR